MRKALFAVPAIAIFTTAAVAGPAVTPASAAPHAPAASTADAKGPLKGTVNNKQYKKYKLTKRELREIQQSRKWAESSKSKSVRKCESGGNYKINTGNGYYGAWQFSSSTWKGIGGKRYANQASGAPKFAQDHMAWKLWKTSGWGPWSCA